jgi:hypothetical protein
MNPKATPYRHRLVAVVLVAAWIGAFAATSPPATGAQAMPRPNPDCQIVGQPLEPGTGTWIC